MILIPLAVTHIIIPIILMDLFRDFVLKKKGLITNKHVLLAGLAGLFPDFDLPISYIFMNGANIHRMYSHNIWLPLLFLAFSMFFYSINKKKISVYFIMMSFGFSIHLLLDSFLAGYINPFYPFSDYSFGLNLVPAILNKISPNFNNRDVHVLIFSSLDAALIFSWLIYIQLREKIKDYF